MGTAQIVKLENIIIGIKVEGILPTTAVEIVSTQWRGQNTIEIIYKRPDGRVDTQLLFRSDESKLRIVTSQQKWAFTADGQQFKLAAEAFRIQLAHLFDPVLAVHTSLIQPLPHQITAVYGEMLTRQPLRYLLADDPGAGKTVMAGLLIKELLMRGDVHRCLICVPGSLSDQWQDELWFKFQLQFEILSREMVESTVSGNPFVEKELLIVRLDQVARSEELQAKLQRSDWDLVIVDEAHKMSASFWGGELKQTKRYKLGQLLGNITRHLLLMTATPHNGKEEDFQQFLALLDNDRFEGRFRGQETHQVDVSDIMRRMVKENLLRFDGRHLFPDRRAYTAEYTLSNVEMELYHAVSEYVRKGFDRAERQLDGQRRGTVGFALTVLQRRLASSPEAIYQSLVRRQERLKKRLQEFEQQRQLTDRQHLVGITDAFTLSADDLEDMEDLPAEELEEYEEMFLDSATAAITIQELQEEIETLRQLEQQAHKVRYGPHDRKWQQLATLLQDETHMVDSNGNRRKIVIFTEHRDTLNYLHENIATLFGQEDAIVRIEGRMRRPERREVEDKFRNDPNIHFLLATDAAGEGINLQRAHLMVNYDLPWNPNRLEQRFGRIHRIGQTEVCHLWNLVAAETREGYVYQRLLRKLETESQALNGKVFDILGDLFTERPLRELLVEAIRYGERPEVRAKLEQAIDNAVDQEHVRDLLDARSLATSTMDLSQIERIRADMERYAARRLQPYHVKAFFMQAFEQLGGTLREREHGRYRITYVPAIIRDRAKANGSTIPVLREYERICFDKELISVKGKPLAQFVCPGHPLLDAVIDLILEQFQNLLRTGTVLIDPQDGGQQPRLLYFLQQTVRDAAQRTVSQEVHFVEIDQQRVATMGGFAPYIDYRPPTAKELAQLGNYLTADWLRGDAFEDEVIGYAIDELIPRHLERVRSRREELIDKTLAAVQERLTKEINYWDGRAFSLRQDEKAGKVNAKLNSERAQKRADMLSARLERRKEELQLEKQLAATPPVVLGGVLVLPMGLVAHDDITIELSDTRIMEAIAMQKVLQAEIALGHYPEDVSIHKLGYDIESLNPRTGHLRFIEVKGRRAGAETITVTRNETITGINVAEQYYLAIVEVTDGQAAAPRYVPQPFSQEPDDTADQIQHSLPKLLAKSVTAAETI